MASATREKDGRARPERIYRYSVRGLTGDDDDEVAGLYDEEHLQATGERATAELFALPGNRDCN